MQPVGLCSDWNFTNMNSSPSSRIQNPRKYMFVMRLTCGHSSFGESLRHWPGPSVEFESNGAS